MVLYYGQTGHGKKRFRHIQGQGAKPIGSEIIGGENKLTRPGALLRAGNQDDCLVDRHYLQPIICL